MAYNVWKCECTHLGAEECHKSMYGWPVCSCPIPAGRRGPKALLSDKEAACILRGVADRLDPPTCRCPTCEFHGGPRNDG